MSLLYILLLTYFEKNLNTSYTYCTINAVLLATNINKFHLSTYAHIIFVYIYKHIFSIVRIFQAYKCAYFLFN